MYHSPNFARINWLLRGPSSSSLLVLVRCYPDQIDQCISDDHLELISLIAASQKLAEKIYHTGNGNVIRKIGAICLRSSIVGILSAHGIPVTPKTLDVDQVATFVYQISCSPRRPPYFRISIRNCTEASRSCRGSSPLLEGSVIAGRPVGQRQWR